MVPQWDRSVKTARDGVRTAALRYGEVVGNHVARGATAIHLNGPNNSRRRRCTLRHAVGPSPPRCGSLRPDVAMKAGREGVWSDDSMPSVDCRSGSEFDGSVPIVRAGEDRAPGGPHLCGDRWEALLRFLPRSRREQAVSLSPTNGLGNCRDPPLPDGGRRDARSSVASRDVLRARGGERRRFLEHRADYGGPEKGPHRAEEGAGGQGRP